MYPWNFPFEINPLYSITTMMYKEPVIIMSVNPSNNVYCKKVNTGCTDIGLLACL